MNWRWVGLLLFILLGFGAFVTVYYVFDPAEGGFFPPCFFKKLTGLPCPGCGTQRMLHQLFHGNFLAAAKLNLFSLLAIPYIAVGFLVEYTPFGHWFQNKYPGLRKNLFGLPAARVAFVIVVAYWIWRIIGNW